MYRLLAEALPWTKDWVGPVVQRWLREAAWPSSVGHQRQASPEHEKGSSSQGSSTFQCLETGQTLFISEGNWAGMAFSIVVPVWLQINFNT